MINMINLNSYIVEKLRINKDIKVLDHIDEINNEFISKIKEYILENYHGLIKFDNYEEYVNVGKSKKYIFLHLRKQHRWIYKVVSKWIEGNLSIEKPCKSNNMILYIYPKYE